MLTHTRVYMANQHNSEAGAWEGLGTVCKDMMQKRNTYYRMDKPNYSVESRTRTRNQSVCVKSQGKKVEENKFRGSLGRGSSGVTVKGTAKMDLH